MKNILSAFLLIFGTLAFSDLYSQVEDSTEYVNDTLLTTG